MCFLLVSDLCSVFIAFGPGFPAPPCLFGSLERFITIIKRKVTSVASIEMHFRKLKLKL